MKVRECFNTVINDDEREMRYSYRLIETEFSRGTAFGIEIERQDIIDNILANIERDSIEIISNDEKKVKVLLDLVYENEVSPIHLVDILGEYADEYVTDFEDCLMAVLN